MSVLLDTNVLSELARPVPEASVEDYCRNIEVSYISVITLHELTFGAKLVKTKSKQKKLLNWIDSIQERYPQSILDVTSHIANRAADLRASASTKGRVLHIEDALIAATALEHSLKLATRNTKDFKNTGTSLVDPWKL
ncbi:MAG: type II toxin-antitoxin system VapC family toxin [Verrucomicrobia bacterium]|nr:type II toxin-antitoxin system VapC family toxin [Verrucomicrobiota bacterium]MDA1066176.1 type II toxin-antitoxin system VapC family toxin [Verrucomicrobiota bacterium]